MYNAKFSRHSYECRASVARRSRDSLAKYSRLSGEKIKLSDNRKNFVRHSNECRATFVRQSRDIFSKLDRNSQICRINVYSMRMQRESCVYIVNLYREKIAKYPRTCLQLSHSSEIGALAVTPLLFGTSFHFH